jgi:hypothetical protein
VVSKTMIVGSNPTSGAILRSNKMTAFLVGLAVGLVVGWNLLPQPKWVSDLYVKVKSKITG